MLHCGLGPTGVNSFLNNLNIRGIHHKSLKQRELEIGKHIREAADESMETALEEEQR